MTNLIFEPANSDTEFFEKALDDLVFSIKEILSEYDECRIGLAGGKTPKKLYTLLAKEKLPWEKIRIIQIDERYVLSDDPSSNLKMLRDTLLKQVPIPPENIITFDTSLPMQSAAKEMSRKMIALSHHRFPIIDIIVLGAGADGHIASLFEDTDSLSCPYYACAEVIEGVEIPERLTLSLITLKSSKRALLLLKGAEKKPVLSALKGEIKEPKITALKELAEKMPIKVHYFF
ncbi:6-phosphogluconolactonase [Patescibacteria group bacterium]|nr:6-phosphogluconolactonase [Patescibacteria group bacterium]